MDAEFWLKAASFGWAVLAPVAAYFWSGHVKRVAKAEAAQDAAIAKLREAADARNKEVDRTIGRIRDRQAELEATMRHGPSKDDVHALAIEVAEVKGSIDKLSEQVGSMGKVSSRIESYLLNHASDK